MIELSEAECPSQIPNSNAKITADMFQVGDQFDHFTIQAHLARGGMADIYRAFDLVTRSEVVIKIPDASLIGDPAQYERFQREINISQSLHHPAVLRGIGVGRFNRIPYLVTELVEGQSLRDLIAGSAPLSSEHAIPLTRKIAEGMAYCHENGVVHRDLKPENILVSPDSQPVIMDFGLALTKGTRRVTYGSLSATMGTPDYMAPEQVEGQRGDPRTDIYALGTILFEMLSGSTPFSGDNPMVVMAMRLNDDAPRIDLVQPGISPYLAAIVACCLQRNPSKRFSDMTALIDALDHPETVDLSILSRLAASKTSSGHPRSMIIRAIAFSIVIIFGLIILALILQTIRP
ncbi:MAG: serine/threonine protein kinase [Anaerolineae bacterium]|nr:serine/threonine protein kinase [Anaerolineae bacterium]